MCVKCCKIEELIITNRINLKDIEELIQDNVLELYAGNCLTEEIPIYMDKGNHYNKFTKITKSF